MARKKISTSWNPEDFGKLGDSKDSGASEDWGKRYMWQKWETLSVRTHGQPTNWEFLGLGDSGGFGYSENWAIREIGKFGRLGDSGKMGKSIKHGKN